VAGADDAGGRGPRRRARNRVPAGRIERLGRIGWMAGEVALGGVAERARRLAGGRRGGSSAFLTGANARRLARRLSRMRGAAMKLGQLLSLEGDDFLPAEVSEALALLRADADAMPDEQVRAVLAAEYGADWESRFARFDPEPIAAASIGQVHEAALPDGSELALKIQYPGVARSIGSDVDNLVAALRMTRLLPRDLDLAALGEEAKRQLRAEADYVGEADRLRRYRELLADDPAFAVPRVHAAWTTRAILAMDRLRGLPLEDLCGPDHPQARRDAVAAELYRLLFRELFEFGFVQTDPNFANYLWLPEGERLGLVDLGAGREVDVRLQDLYARLIQAGILGDRAGVREAALAIGLYEAGEREDRVERLVDMMMLACEAFGGEQPHDFAGSGHPARMRELGTDLALGRGFWRPPPIDSIYLHRKLGGTYLLAARLRARVDLRALIRPFLERRLAG
jgi:predicted unusual protein kinase regulating ubiquinone biosynthesis (AarF/ABC1/UbiB family)